MSPSGPEWLRMLRMGLLEHTTSYAGIRCGCATPSYAGGYATQHPSACSLLCGYWCWYRLSGIDIMQ